MRTRRIPKGSRAPFGAADSAIGEKRRDPFQLERTKLWHGVLLRTIAFGVAEEQRAAKAFH